MRIADVPVELHRLDAALGEDVERPADAALDQALPVGSVASRRLGGEDRRLGVVVDQAGRGDLTRDDGDRTRLGIQFGGLKAEDAKRLKDLERENATLKRLLADAELEKDALREIAKGNF